MKASRTASYPLLMLTAIVLAIAASAGASAQKFQYVYGGGDDEAGRGGGRPVSNGGYVAVGETFTPDGGNTSDIYVVRTEGNGSLAWSWSYDAGGNDSATDVEELFEMVVTMVDSTIVYPPIPPDTMPRVEHHWRLDTTYAHDGFILTGVTDNESLDEWEGDPSRDLFLLRLDECGNIVWWKTYGRDTTDEIGWDVDVTSVEDGMQFRWGDFIVAGTTTQHNAAGSKRNGYLLRTDNMGNIKWDRTYDIDSAKDDDYFYSLDECHIAKNMNGMMVGVGDIVVGGGTYRYGNDPDALIGRVQGNSGLLGGLLCGFYVLKRAGADDFRSVIERKKMHAGFIVAFGFVSVAGDRDVYGVEMQHKPVGAANLNAQIAFGSDDDDEAYEVREMDGVGSMNQALIVTGYYSDEFFGLGGKDAFLQEIDPFNFNRSGNIHVYGGPGTDWGWSVSLVDELKPDPMLPPCRNTGFVVAGFTDSDLPGEGGLTVDAQDLYLIKTDRQKVSGCNETDFEITDYDPPINDRMPNVDLGMISRVKDPTYEDHCELWELQLCFDPDGTRDCALPWCMPCFPDFPPPNDTVIVRDTVRVHDTLVIKSRISHTMVDLDRTGVLASYPNPVVRGGMLNLRYTLPNKGEATITVSDLLGNTIYQSTDPHGAGSNLKVIPTATWGIGTYLVRMQSALHTATMRVIVVDR